MTQGATSRLAQAGWLLGLGVALTCAPASQAKRRDPAGADAGPSANAKRCPGPIRAKRLETEGRARSRQHRLELLAAEAVATGRNITNAYWRGRQRAFAQPLKAAWAQRLAAHVPTATNNSGTLGPALCHAFAGPTLEACDRLPDEEAEICRAFHATREASVTKDAERCAKVGPQGHFCRAVALGLPCPEAGPGAELCAAMVAAMADAEATCAPDRSDAMVGCLPTLLLLALQGGEGQCDLAFAGDASRREQIRRECHAVLRQRPQECPGPLAPQAPTAKATLEGMVRGGAERPILVLQGSATAPLICWVSAEVRDGRGRRRARWQGVIDLPVPGKVWTRLEVPLDATVDPFDADVRIERRCVGGFWR